MKKIIVKLTFFHIIILLFLISISFIHVKKEKDNTSGITVNYKDINTGTVQKLDVEEYIVGVVAAEMPASFEFEALKAQAVATRTYSIRNGALLTNDINTSQAYNDLEGLKKKWGKSFEANYKKVKQAVEQTRGEVIKYNGNLISAVYHSTSAGSTQNSGDVWKTDEPYLKSVMSIEDKAAPGYSSVITIAEKELAQKLGITGKLKIDKIERYESGYVKVITINKKEFKGPEFRKLLNLRSNNFEVLKKDGNYVINTKGYGHGVGMSQYGANFLAKEGKNYIEILKHYYSGVDISKIEN